ncbi:MAG: S41 family peptidase [Proteobacteria bacterium]|jgi:hypothetical protein|nr:S41 family peptidase [Pseudomonadota bacterium]
MRKSFPLLGIFSFLLLGTVACTSPDDYSPAIQAEGYSIYTEEQKQKILDMNQLSLKERQEILISLSSAMKNSYIGYDLKKDLIGQNIGPIIDSCLSAEAQIPTPSSTFDFFDRLKVCVGKMKDGHLNLRKIVRPAIVTTALASLAMTQDGVVLHEVRPNLLSEFQRMGWLSSKEVSLLTSGVKVLEIDDQPALTAVKEFGKRISSSSEKANLTEAAEDFFLRTSHYPQKTTIKLKVETSTGSTQMMELPWVFYSPKKGDFLESPLALGKKGIPHLESSGLSQLPSRQGTKVDEPVFSLQLREDYLNLEEDPVLTTGEAEIFGKKVCYLQIRSFDVDESQGIDSAIVRSSDSAEGSMLTTVENFLARCQSTTEALILDLRNNTGGDSNLAEKIGLLIENPLSQLPARASALRLTRGNLSFFQSFLDIEEIDQVRQKYLLESLVVQDKETLTPWIAIQNLSPSRGTFQKPILTLISEKCISACEMMVNRLQIQSRGILAGTPTHGTGFGFSWAGVSDTLWRDSMNLFSMRIPNHAFQSILVDSSKSEPLKERAAQFVVFKSDDLMENRPRKPDIVVEYSALDFKNGLSAYRSQIERILGERVLPPNP